MRSHLLRAAAGTAAAAGSGGGGSAAYVTDDLVFHIDAGNSSSYSGSGTTVNSLVGSITSSSFDTDISYSSSVGGCFDFTSSDTSHGIAFDASSFMPFGSNSVTLEMWYLTQNTSYNTPFMLSRVDQNVHRGNIYMIERYTNRFSVYKEKANQYQILLHSPNNTLPRDTWHHCVASLNTTYNRLTLYINGSQVATSTSSAHYGSFYHESTDSAYNINIGGSHSGSLDLEGYVSIARIYKGRALSTSEVTQNYNAEKARHGY